jgi:uncharacterized membrane protein YeiB
MYYLLQTCIMFFIFYRLSLGALWTKDVLSSNLFATAVNETKYVI